MFSRIEPTLLTQSGRSAARPPNAALAASLLVLLFSLGCRSPRQQIGAAFFPIGLYGVPRADLAQVRNAGFNAVTGSASPAFLDEAARHGLSVLSSPPNPLTLTNSTAIKNLRRADSHPALWSWYLFDEPDLHRVSPTNIWRRNRELTRLTRKPTTLILMSGTSAIHYRSHSDIIGLDFYPVPWAPISQFSKELKLTRFALRDQPYFAILQAFDWTAFSELLDTRQPLRAPTYQELRCMVYIALAQQAKGLFFYSFKSGEWHLPDHPLWTHLQPVVREINDYLPLFTARHLWWSPETEYLDGTDSSYNEVRDGKISLVLLEVSKGNSLVVPGRYALAINTTVDTVRFQLELPHENPTVPLLLPRPSASATNPASLPLVHRTLYHDFAPYEVLCLGPLHLPP